MSAMEVDLRYLSREPDRHGNIRWYVRRNGKRIRLRLDPSDPSFTKAYYEAVDKLGPTPSRMPQGPGIRGWAKDTLGWLGTQLFEDHDAFKKLDKDSRRARRNSLEAMFEVPHSETDPEPMGNCPLKHFSAQKAKRLIASDRPGAGNRRKHLSALCAFAVEEKHLPMNMVRDTRAGTGQAKKGGGFHTWTIEEVRQYLDYHRGEVKKPERRTRSLKAILALSLLLFGGMRRQDMVTIGKQHCRGPKPDVLGDWIRYLPKKREHRSREVSQKPLLPVLRDVITECAEVLGDMTFLVTERGKPFTEAGIGNWFRDRCDDAGLKHCTAHGLKKAGATIAAENRATTRQLMAMFDWDSVRMAEVYTKAAEQKRLAGEAMFLITLERSGHEDCRTTPIGVVAPDQKVS